MHDVCGERLNVGDEVFIYWGYNQLRPAVVKQISKNKAKVFCDGSLSKWKTGECMVKVSAPTGYYPDEVILLIQKIIALRDEAPANKDGLVTKQLCQDLLNYWDKTRPCDLVCS